MQRAVAREVASLQVSGRIALRHDELAVAYDRWAADEEDADRSRQLTRRAETERGRAARERDRADALREHLSAEGRLPGERPAAD